MQAQPNNNLLPGQKLVTLRDIAERKERILAAQQRLIPFCEFMYPKWQSRPHKELIAGALEMVEFKQIDLLMIFAPPRHFKSVLAKYYAAWSLGRDPNQHILLCSYSD